MNVDRCTSCGAIIPEGRQVCPGCEAEAMMREVSRKLKRKIKIRRVMNMAEILILIIAALAALAAFFWMIAGLAEATPPKEAAEVEVADAPLPPLEPLTEEEIAEIMQESAVYECGEGAIDCYAGNPPEVMWIPSIGWCATEEELELAARIVWLEARGESANCQRRIAEVIFNRLKSGLWGHCLCDVIYSRNADGNPEFSTAVHAFDEETEVDAGILDMVKDVFQNGCQIPARVLYFRAGGYHRWEGAVDEFCFDNTYFSSSKWAAVE